MSNDRDEGWNDLCNMNMQTQKTSITLLMRMHTY